MEWGCVENTTVSCSSSSSKARHRLAFVLTGPPNRPTRQGEASMPKKFTAARDDLLPWGGGTLLDTRRLARYSADVLITFVFIL